MKSLKSFVKGFLMFIGLIWLILFGLTIVSANLSAETVDRSGKPVEVYSVNSY